MKRFLVWCGKAIISGFIAFFVLTLFCLFYYNVPVHHSNPDGYTDYVWEKNKFYSRGTEGFAMGLTNNEGHINSFDYEEDMPISILIMGSSHTEAYNVSVHESFAAKLNEMLPNETVYNIGTSAHNFLVCADNFEAALEKYAPTEYVVIEAFQLYYSDDDLQLALDGQIPEQPSYNYGILNLLQKNTFLRRIYSQLDGFFEKNNEVVSDEDKTITSIEIYDKLLEKLARSSKKAGVKLIILHQSNLILDKSGSASTCINEVDRKIFSALCEKNDICFIDMTDTFIHRYERDHILPHGFCNTSVGVGHLNKHGHEMIANVLYDFICEVE